jgi:SAM-dependent methyltransferase
MPKSQPDYKRETLKVYDQFHEEFEQKFQHQFSKPNVQNLLNQFLTELKGKDILDLGSGPGFHSRYFLDRGYQVLAVDNSPAMVELCRKKDVPAKEMDMENLDLKGSRFDGIWAYASLLHLPKEKIPGVIKDLTALLRPRGCLGLAVKEGQNQGFKNYKDYPGAKRWFTYLSDQEIKHMFRQNFTLIDQSRDNYSDNRVFLNYLFQLK